MYKCFTVQQFRDRRTNNMYKTIMSTFEKTQYIDKYVEQTL